MNATVRSTNACASSSQPSRRRVANSAYVFVGDPPGLRPEFCCPLGPVEKFLPDGSPWVAFIQGPLRFSIDALLYGEQYQGPELMPFFTIHEARYTMYWRVNGEQELGVDSN
jgi:hypothetical protein